MKLPTIQSLWIGNDLTNLEKLCIQSFLDNGHEFHLYTYGDIGGIPDGAVVKDGNEILSADKIFYCRDGRIGPFTDWFRYEMLDRFGGYWVDMDYVCLKPFDLPQDVVFCRDEGGSIHTAIIKFPVGHKVVKELAGICAATKHREKLRYGDFYHLLAPALRRHNLFGHALPVSTLFPLESLSMSHIFESGGGIGNGTFTTTAYGMHLANGLTRHIAKFQPKFSMDANFPADSVFELLKKKHNITPATNDEPLTHEEVATAFIDFRTSEVQGKETKKRKLKKKLGFMLIVVFLVGFGAGLVL